MNADETKPGLAIRVIWLDEDMVELACSLAHGKFAGEATCYTTSPQLHDFADALSRFSRTAEGQPTFESSLSDGSKACRFRAYTIDKAGHMAVHVRMLNNETTTRPESVARLEVEMLVEAWSLSEFAEQLRQIARTRTGEAMLAVSDAPA
jgi:hypothetical protein